MPIIRLTTREGEQLSLEAEPQQSLMELLRDNDSGVEGTCGGECACGTCHVYIEQGGENLGPRSEEEQDMLEAIGELVEVRNSSRLSCCIQVPESTDVLEVTVGPVP